MSEEKREGLRRERLMLRLREVRVDVNCRININSYRHYTKPAKKPLFSLRSFQKKHEKIWVETNSIKSDSKGSELKK